MVTELENSTNWKQSNGVNLLAGDFMLLLAEEWVSRTYEVLRLLKQRLLANSELRSYWTEELNSVFEKFENIRVSLFKREIHKGAKLDHKVELVTADGEATPYIHGSSVTHSQPRIRESDNSIGFAVYNPNTKIDEILFRKDLSKHILNELLELRVVAG